MICAHDTLLIHTPGRGIYELTAKVHQAVKAAAITSGLCTLFVQHTSASLLVNENADPTVRKDLETFLSRLVPDGDRAFLHRDEGPDDMPAHIRMALTLVSLTIPIRNARLQLGTWQGIYLWEHRTHAHQRKILLTCLGDT